MHHDKLWIKTLEDYIQIKCNSNRIDTAQSHNENVSLLCV